MLCTRCHRPVSKFGRRGTNSSRSSDGEQQWKGALQAPGVAGEGTAMRQLSEKKRQSFEEMEKSFEEIDEGTWSLNVVIACVLSALGLLMVRIGLEPDKPYWHEVLNQLGMALFTAAIIEILAFRGIRKLKQGLNAAWKTRHRELRALLDRIYDVTEQAQQSADEINESTFRTKVEANLESIAQQVEHIRNTLYDVQKRQIQGNT